MDETKNKTVPIIYSLRLPRGRRQNNAYVNDVLTKHEHKHKHKRKELMLMLMSRLSSLAHKLLTLMFMLMLASLVRTGLYVYAYACFASEDWAELIRILFISIKKLIMR